MPNRSEHLALSRWLFGHNSLGNSFQRVLDFHVQQLGQKGHRRVGHSYERLERIVSSFSGELEPQRGVVEAEILLHLAADYGLIDPEMADSGHKREENRG